MIDKIFVATAIFSLFMTITNFVPLSAIIVLFILYLPLVFMYRKNINKLTFSLFCLLGYCVLSTLIYYPPSFLYYDFYRRDGNIFISYLPLLMLSVVSTKINVSQLLKIFIYYATFINVIFYIIYLANDGVLFYSSYGLYHFLFVAHNAAAGFLMVLTAFSLGCYCATRKKSFLIITIINIVILFATGSRGSIIGLFLGCIMFFVSNNIRKKMFASFILLQIFFLSWVYINAPSNFLDISSFSVASDIVDAENISVENRIGTVIIRTFYLWPKAIYLFVNSPILGTGFGSYNDWPYRLYELFPLCQINIVQNAIFDSSHAHHSYLHFLAETGIVGLGLLIFVFRQIFIHIEKISEASLKNALYLAVWSAIFSSFTEHRITTPAQMLPIIILLGLSISSRNYKIYLKAKCPPCQDKNIKKHN